MKRWLFALASLISILTLTVLFPTVVSGQDLKETIKVTAPSPRYKPGEVMVWFRPGTPGKAKAAAHAAVQGQVLRQYRIVPGLQEVRLPKGMSVEQGIARYVKNPNVLRAYPNYPIKLDATPDDTWYASQWALNNTGQRGGTPDADIDAPEAWDLTTGSSNVVVAVIDTGVYYNHPDLAANIWENPQDCNANGQDDDHNGYADDCHGIDTGSGDSDPKDYVGHGTHVAGIIGAVGDNNLGVVGVNWHVKIMACKVFEDDGTANTLGWRADEVACLDYIADMKDRGVNIVAVNASYGDVFLDPGEFSAIDILRQKGILFVAAAGNDGWDIDVIPTYPAHLFLPNLIAVANTNSTDGLRVTSNYGRRSVLLGAPGTDILSTVIPNNTMVDPEACSPDGLYCFVSGTSMSAPFVTGVAALLKAYNPSLDWRAIKNLILAGGNNISSLVDKTVTEKRLNANGALTCSNSTLLSPLQPSSAQSTTGVGEPLDLAALHINCAQPSGNVQVTVNGDEDVVTLRDDGSASDQATGDGIYSGQFVPAYPGSYALGFPGGETTTTYALRNYRYSEIQPVYRDITGSSLNLAPRIVSCYSLSTFRIQFGGTPFSDFCVGGNGLVSLTNLYSTLNNNAIPDGQVYNLIAPFWDQLSPERGTTRNIYLAILGTSPNRELVLEWRNVRDYACSSTGGVTFQIVFSENKDDILFNYKDVTFGGECGDADGGGSATVGVQVGQHTGTQYSFNTRSLTGGMSILWTTGSLGVSPSSIDFGSVRVGDTSPAESVTLSNESGSAITISSIAVTGDFHQSSNCGSSLAANANCKIDVTFTPTATGPANGELTISSSAPGGDKTVTLTGSGVVPVVKLSRTSITFAEQKVGTSSSPETVTLTNDGGAMLSISDISTSVADFTETDDCPGSLNAGDSCRIDVTFNPTAVGTRDGYLTVTSNSESKTDSVKLTGEGQPGGILSPSPATLDFGDLLVGSTSDAKNVKLTNTGTATLEITDIVADPPFDATKDCVGNLEVSASCTIQVTFVPTAAGLAAAPLTVTSDVGDAHVDLTGKGIAPVANLLPASIDFGSQKVGVESSAKSVTLKNTGTATLNITGIKASAPFALQNNGCGSTLAADASCSVEITFKPTSTGTANGKLTVDSDADSSPDEVALTGEGALPVVVLSPTSLDFGQIEVNSTSDPKPVTLKNDGAVVLSITGITATGDFTKSDDCGTSLDAGQSCTIDVTFKPTATGARTGQLTVTSDAASKTDAVNLTGEGIVGTLSLSPVSLDMGDQLVGVESPSKNVTLTNTGTATVNSIQVAADAPFLQTNTCPTSLAASASCTIQVTFKPTTTGTATGQLTVTSGAPDSPHSVALTGNGVVPVVSLSPASIDFGGQPVGETSSAKNATLTNTGAGTLNISSIVASAPFAQSNNCGNSLAANASCNIDVTFTPTTTDTVTGQVTIEDNASGSPHTISLSGKGNKGDLSYSVSTLDFGKQLKGTGSQQQLVTLTNIGGAPVTVSDVKLQSGGTDFYLAGQSCENRSPIAAGNNCSVGIEFKPTATGPLTDILEVYSDAPGSPHTLTLTGEGTDFSVGMAPGSSNSATVTAGQAATYNLSIAPVEGFEGSATLTCKWDTPQPQGTACTVTPATLNVNGNGAVNATVRITTTARSMAPVGWEPQQPPPTSYPVSHLAIWLLALAALASLALRRRRATVVLASVLFMVVLWAACGGGDNNYIPPPPSGTPVGTSTLTVTGTSSGMSHSVNLTLDVK